MRTAARRLRPAAAAALAAAALAAAPAAGQDLAGRVAGIGDGVALVSFPARADLCADATGTGRPESRPVLGRDDVRWDGPGRACERGPVRVAVLVRDHGVRDLHTFVGGHWRIADGAPAVDLGTVDAAAAVAWLLGLARTAPPATAEDAVFPASLARTETWPGLLALARDARAARRVRKQATFWLGQAAAREATAGLAELAGDDSADLEVREAAVFALSQRQDGEGVPALVRVARTSPSPEIRRKALFWLGQSEDPRALALFEEILTSP